MKELKKHLTNERLVETVMISFAIASVFNVTTYLSAHGHGIYFSVILGSGIGFGLVSVSMLLSKVDRTDKTAFNTMLTVTLLFALTSGVLQCLAYLSHGLNIYLAAFFGLIFPTLMEFGLAYAMSTFHLSEKKRKLKLFNEGFSERITEKIALSTDLDSIEIDNTYLKERLVEIVRYKTDEALSLLMPEETKKTFKSEAKPLEPVEPTTRNTDIGNSATPIKSESYATFLALMEKRYAHDVNQINKSNLASELAVSVPTIYKYIKRYQEAKC